MPAKTELIPCPTCKVPRRVVVRKTSERRKLLARPCRTCAHPYTSTTRKRHTHTPEPEQIVCRLCGVPRPVIIATPSARERANKAVCLACANKARNQTRPIYDVDEMAVERLIAGQPVNATPAERRQAVAYLTRSRLSATEIARRIGCTPRTVVRHRSKLAA